MDILYTAKTSKTSFFINIVTNFEFKTYNLFSSSKYQTITVSSLKFFISLGSPFGGYFFFTLSYCSDINSFTKDISIAIIPLPSTLIANVYGTAS